MKLYLVCPLCGTKYAKAEEVKAMDFQCPKCRESWLADVTAEGVHITKQILAGQNSSVKT